MPNYLVSFQVHLIKKLLPPDFPAMVSDDRVFKANSSEELSTKINQQAAEYIRNYGFIVFKDPKNVDLNLRDQKMFLPLHVLAFLDTKTMLLADSPVDLETGKLEGEAT